MKTFFWTSMVWLLALVGFWVSADYFAEVRSAWTLVLPQSVVEDLMGGEIESPLIDSAMDMMDFPEEDKNLPEDPMASGDVVSGAEELLVDNKALAVDVVESKSSTGDGAVVVENIPLVSGAAIPLQEQIFDSQASHDLNQEQELQYWKSRVQILEYYLMTLLNESYQTKGGSQLSLPTAH